MLTSEKVEETTQPGQRLKQVLISSLFSTLIVILIFALPVVLFVGLRLGLHVGLSRVLPIGLIYGLLFGLLVGVIGRMVGKLSDLQIGGYFTLIQHYSLRLILAQYHFLPRQLIGFLEYAVRLIFLRRVGGSYIFVHRLRMEHFADMEVQPDKPGA